MESSAFWKPSHSGRFGAIQKLESKSQEQAEHRVIQQKKRKQLEHLKKSVRKVSRAIEALENASLTRWQLVQLYEAKLGELNDAYRLTGLRYDVLNNNTIKVHIDTYHEGTFFHSYDITVKLQDAGIKVEKLNVPYSMARVIEEVLSREEAGSLKGTVDLIARMIRAYVEKKHQVELCQRMPYCTVKQDTTLSRLWLELDVVGSDQALIELNYAADMQSAFPSQVEVRNIQGIDISSLEEELKKSTMSEVVAQLLLGVETVYGSHAGSSMGEL